MHRRWPYDKDVTRASDEHSTTFTFIQSKMQSIYRNLCKTTKQNTENQEQNTNLLNYERRIQIIIDQNRQTYQHEPKSQQQSSKKAGIILFLSMILIGLICIAGYVGIFKGIPDMTLHYFYCPWKKRYPHHTTNRKWIEKNIIVNRPNLSVNT